MPQAQQDNFAWLLFYLVFKENSDYILYNQEEKEDLENQIASIKILQ